MAPITGAPDGLSVRAEPDGRAACSAITSVFAAP